MEKRAAKKNFRVVWLLCGVLLLAGLLLRMPHGETQNYVDADATYHVLFTMQAYSETPASVHHFLPLVSLGGEANKNIPWGACVPSGDGNYYYTSFSPAGFVAPYLFVKLFHLPITAQSLWLFNTVLLCGCWALCCRLFLRWFTPHMDKKAILFFVSILYLFQNEVMHSQGLVYWHQSLFQLVLLAQLNLFASDKRAAKIGFFALCLLAPYVEWSGYVANVGFALAAWLAPVFTGLKKHPTWKSFGRAVGIGLCTLGGGVLFVLHYLSVIPLQNLLDALSGSFGVRSATAQAASVRALAKGYFQSYGLLLALLAVMAVGTLCNKKARGALALLLQKTWLLAIVLLVPVLENLLLVEHATEYTYDRLKAVLPLLYVALVLLCALQQGFDARKVTALCAVACLMLAATNLIWYSQTDNVYRRQVNYLERNRAFAANVAAEYTCENSILVHENLVTRGYANLLFDRGVFELTDPQTACTLARKRGVQYVVFLDATWHEWNLYEYTGIRVCDTYNNVWLDV